jgi:hypothetical protein
MTAPNQHEQTDFTPGNFLTSFFSTAKAVLLSPRSFYRDMRTDGAFQNPLIFLVCCVVIHTLFVSLLMKNQMMAARNMALGIGMPFVTAGIFFIIITRLFKASGTYEAAFRVTAYAATLNLFSWIPIPWVLVLVEFYRLYLFVIGLSYAFSIKVSKAALSIVITVLTYAILGSIFGPILMGNQGPTPTP